MFQHLIITRAGSLYQCPLTQARGDCSILPGIVPGDTRPPRTDEVCSIAFIIVIMIIATIFVILIILTPPGKRRPVVRGGCLVTRPRRKGNRLCPQIHQVLVLWGGSEKVTPITMTNLMMMVSVRHSHVKPSFILLDIKLAFFPIFVLLSSPFPF